MTRLSLKMMFSVGAFALAAHAHASDAAKPAAYQGDPAKGKEIASTVCIACHGADGNSPTSANPKLAGQHAGYLFKQMKNFKAGADGKSERVNAIMNGMIAPYTEEQMKDLAAYFASQKQTGGEAKNRDTSVREGEALWSAFPAPGRPACAACHGAAPAGMKGVAARYPARRAGSATVIDLPERIRLCQSEQQQGSAQPRDSAPLLALEAYVALQSREMPIEPPSARGLDDAVARGAQLYTRRMGQLDLSCAQCHSQNWGRMLGGTRIPQAHPTGYPVFRMEWQAVGSLQRRIRNCLTGVRAQPFAPGAADLIDLEAFLKQRAAAMPMDAPGVRP